MVMEIKVPEVGESVVEALVAKWLKADGEQVRKDEPLCEIETDKITFEIAAEAAGRLSIKVPEGTTVKIGAVIATLDEAAAGAGERPPAAPPVASLEPAPEPPHVSPSARKLAREQVAAAPAPAPPAGRVPERVEAKAPEPPERAETVVPPLPGEERETRRPMTPIRMRIAERLVAARQQTAMLTTFNEADLTRVRELRSRHGDHFQTRHGVKLGLMSFFVKAVVEALKEYPAVNARIDASDIVYHNFYDIGIAVSGEKGLVVPVLRGADRLHFWEIEQAIAGFIDRVRTNRLALADLEGGTFTISNGGVFGSLLSTPILNPPQSGVLGMHAVQDRPVVREGQIVIRPMMYLALSYDHRIIDGREAVSFLRRVKEYVEEPEEIFLEG
jgi:2-oxoglutarate dehydrogenase E2 component (dihydrolipoamide succinyltransferase)